VKLVVSIAQTALFLFMLLLLARIVLSLVLSVSREWHPKGVALVATEGVFTATDPPLKMLRRIIPPLRLGQVRLDLAFLVLFLATSFLWSTLGNVH